MGERRGTKALETWCRRVTQGYPGVKVENMTTSWRDGLAFCAMIHHFRPDLIDFTRLDKSDIYGNNELAFRIAERHLGIPALLDAEDMAEYPVPDRLSILTYLSQFYQAFASNSSSPIKKPSSDSPEGSLVSLVQGNVQQPTKMEEGSLLRRREPCAVCNNPVFIAQRLRIDGKLYHRTCFRCARCSTQLSLADYYETHDGQYCCETCPDEIIMDSAKTKYNDKEILEEEIGVSEQQQQQQQKDELKQSLLYASKLKTLPPEPPPPSTVVNKDPTMIASPTATTSPITTTTAAGEEPSTLELSSVRPSASLVAIRRMMFDSYNKDTDDAKLIINNKKDLSLNIDSSSHKIKSSSNNEETIVNKNNNNNNNVNNRTNDSNNTVDDIINNRAKKMKTNDKGEDTHQFSERTIIEKNDRISSNNDLVDNVNKQLVDDNNRYKFNKNNDKSLPLSMYSDTTPVDSVQVSGIVVNERLLQQNDTEEEEVAEDVSDERNLVNKGSREVLNKEIENIISDHVEEKLSKKIEDKPFPKERQERKPEIVKPKPTSKRKTSIESSTASTSLPTVVTTKASTSSNEYPDDLNPFGDEDDVDRDDSQFETSKKSTNPFGSDSEDDEEEHSVAGTSSENSPFKNLNESSILNKSSSTNPFDSDDDDDETEEEIRKPVPLPRKNVLSPEPTPFPRSRLRGSLRSINSLSSTCSLPSPRKKKPAPLPPSSPCSTLSRSPKPRKTKRAPLPPSSSTLSIQSSESMATGTEDTLSKTNNDINIESEANKSEISKEISNIVNLISVMATEEQGDDKIIKSVENATEKVDKISVEDVVVNEEEETIKSGETVIESKEVDSRQTDHPMEQKLTPKRRNSTQCDEPLDFPSLPTKEPISGPRSLNESIGDLSSAGHLSYASDNSASLNASFAESLSSPISEKKNKDSFNMHRKISESGSVYLPKSSHGQWRRKKAPAPPLPLPTRRQVKPMPIQNIRQELNDIEIKQQGLERQGVALENKIRDKFDSESTITPYVEELVLQLFELVNEKNELFRKQAELMYLRRQQHLEEEHSELEYQIRCLMARPEANKTDSDKELEEHLIQRLVEVVERRDAIVQCLEMDRLREAEEDHSINTQLGIFTLAMAKEIKLTTKKKFKKNKAKQNALKMMDLDKDVDDMEKESKKKKKWFSLQHIKGKHL